MTAVIGKLTLGVLYVAVFLLVAVPPLLVMQICKGGDVAGDGGCAGLTSRALFGGEVALVWMPPLVLAAVLIWVIFRLRNSALSGTATKAD